MKFAHMSQVLPRPGEPVTERFDQIWRELELADEVDFDYGFASVHHFSRLRPSTTAYCAAAAQRTSRMRIGTMGYVVALIDPIRIVEETAVLDHITHGRLEVGLIAGGTPEEFRIYSGDWENRHALATEGVQLLRKAFTSDLPFDFEGPFHKYERIPMSVEPIQRPHPPIWLISLMPEQLKMSAQEGVHTGYVLFRPRLDAAPFIKDYLQMWGQHGHQHKPNICYLTTIYVDETDEAAVKNAAPHIIDSAQVQYSRALGLVDSPEIEYHNAPKQGFQALGPAFRDASVDAQKYVDFDYLHDNDLIFVGSPDTVARKLKAASAEGLFNVICAEFNIGRIPEEDMMRSIRLFGTEVIPALRDFDPTREYV